jgi:hypothetical protein
VKSFVDPSVQFGLQFTVDEEAGEREISGDAKGKLGIAPPAVADAKTSVPERLHRPESKPGIAEIPKSGAPEGPRKEETTGEVVKFDRFRKK